MRKTFWLLLATWAICCRLACEAQQTAGRTNQFYYDRNDRLVGAEYARGLSIVYVYDGNGNLTRQAYLDRSSETNGLLPVLWQFLNGLTNNTVADGPYGDPDGDGWSNLQEWMAGSDPRDAASTPAQLHAGEVLLSSTAAVAPVVYHLKVADFNGDGRDDVAIGFEGAPGTSTNYLRIVQLSSEGFEVDPIL